MKRSYTLTIFTIAFMLIMIVSATYAYFATDITTTNNVVINTTVPNAKATFTSYSTDSLQLNVGLANLLIASSNASAIDTGNLIVKLQAPSAGFEAVCTYDIRYVWDSTDQYTTPTMTLTTTYPYELSLTATASASGDSFSSYDYSSKNVVERNLSTFSWIGSDGTVGRYTTLVSGAKIYANTTSGTTVTWLFNQKFYTLPSDQTIFVGKSLQAHIVTDNIQC